jgi:hypothetical protein
LRLNISGTAADVERIGAELVPGLEVEVVGDGLRCIGVIERLTEKGVWVARIDWSAVEEC